jgi:tocopherol O-methyltransferase
MHPSDVTLKARIRDHYDRLSPVYQEMWGNHIHHGYWIDGRETKERAQEQLVEVLAQRVGISPRARILDVGCGIGGSAISLARRYKARVTGITISPVQAAMAFEHATRDRVKNCNFAAMDAEAIAIRDRFDFIWAVEALSHIPNKNLVFSELTALLRPRGRFVIADWFKGENLAIELEKEYLQPVITSMLLPELTTMRRYAELLRSHKYRIMVVDDLTPHVSKTWDLCMQMWQIPAVWQIATTYGPDFIAFLRGFRAMKRAFETGVFRYGLIVAERISTPPQRLSE